MTHEGIVLKGMESGTKLGFPTANILLNDSEVSGVYAGAVLWNGKTYSAAIYANQRRNILEAHLLNFSENLYGQKISITLLKKIRDDVAFNDEPTLIEKISEDVQHAREYFANNTLEI